jgi:hypothetical protein
MGWASLVIFSYRITSVCKTQRSENLFQTRNHGGWCASRDAFQVWKSVSPRHARSPHPLRQLAGALPHPPAQPAATMQSTASAAAVHGSESAAVTSRAPGRPSGPCEIACHQPKHPLTRTTRSLSRRTVTASLPSRLCRELPSSRRLGRCCGSTVLQARSRPVASRSVRVSHLKVICKGGA